VRRSKGPFRGKSFVIAVRRAPHQRMPLVSPRLPDGVSQAQYSAKLARRVMRHCTAWGLAYSALLVSCGLDGDFPGPTYETEHLRILTSFEDPLCRGDLLELEGFIDSVQTTLGIEMSEPVDVYLRDEFSDTRKLECGGRGACYRASMHSVFTTPSVIHHELTHAITASAGFPSAFLIEGIAMAMDKNVVLFGGVELTSQLSLTTKKVSYIAAGHFTRWLLDTYGAAKWRELYSHGSGKTRHFERVYGKKFASLQEEYFESAPWIYPPLYHYEVPWMEENTLGWRENFVFDCSSSDTFGRIGIIVVLRTLEISTPGMYDVWTSADGVSLSRDIDRPIDTIEEAERAAYGDAPISSSLTPIGGIAYVPGGTLRTLELDAGIYTVYVGDIDRDAEQALVTILPHRGGLNHIPEPEGP